MSQLLNKDIDSNSCIGPTGRTQNPDQDNTERASSDKKADFNNMVED